MLIQRFQSSLKAEQLRQQFSRAEADRTDLSRKLEEAQGKVEENESARKRLQNRLDSLNRQMEEGQGDRERLVEQLESLRGQVRGTLFTCCWLLLSFFFCFLFHLFTAMAFPKFI